MRLRSEAVCHCAQDAGLSRPTGVFDFHHGSSHGDRFVDVNATPSSHHLMRVPSMEIAVPGPRDDDELAALVGRARGGNTAAFDELARRVRDRVRHWAAKLVTDADDAEDVAQLVLVRMHERLDDFEGRSRFASWLYRITRNVALERRRLEARRIALLARDAELTRAMSAQDATVDASDDVRVRDLLVRQLQALPPRQREVFELVDLNGINAADAAKQLGIEASTARVLLLRARRTIRTRMLALHPTLLEDYRT
jgi:RNA polymerase sigma-70 factor (ECF subfamily)